MSNKNNPKPSVMKQAAMQITAGGSAGFIEVCLMHPLDVVKTRLQLQIKKPLAGGNTGNTVRFMFKNKLSVSLL